MIVTYIVVFCIVLLVVIFGLYFITTYIRPKKIGEIEAMISSGQIKLAIKKLEEILEKDDRNSYAHFLLAKAYLLSKNKPYAIMELRKVLKISHYDADVKEVEVRTLLANTLKEQKSLDAAKKEFLILTKIEPNNYKNYYELGDMYFQTGLFDKATNYLKKSISLNKNHEKSHFLLGQVFYRSGNYSEAKNSFLEVIKNDKGNYRAHYFLGLVLRQLGDVEWAVKELEIAQKDQTLRVKCFLAKGSCFLEKEQFPKAVVEFEKGIKYAQKGSDIELNLHYYKAMAHENLRDLTEAIKSWERIAEVNAKFKDVSAKLAQYSEFRQDDSVKDFMIAGLANFEHIARKMVEVMGYDVAEVTINSDTDIEIVATDSEGKWRNARKTNRIVRIMRITNKISDNVLRDMHEKMRIKNATRITVLSTGDYTKTAMDYANTRPIELISKTEIVDILKKANS